MIPDAKEVFSEETVSVKIPLYDLNDLVSKEEEKACVRRGNPSTKR